MLKLFDILPEEVGDAWLPPRRARIFECFGFVAGFVAGGGGAGTSLVTLGLAIANEEHSPNEMHSSTVLFGEEAANYLYDFCELYFNENLGYVIL